MIIIGSKVGMYGRSSSITMVFITKIQTLKDIGIKLEEKHSLQNLKKGHFVTFFIYFPLTIKAINF